MYQQPPVYYQPPVQQEGGALSVCALVFAVIVPFVGLILGIIGVCRHNVPNLKKRCKIAIIISVIMMVVSLILSVIMVAVLLDFAKEVVSEFPYEQFPFEDFSGEYYFYS